MDERTVFNVDLMQGLIFLQRSLDEMNWETIRNCFKHVGVHCEPNAEIDIDDPEGFVVEGQIPPENSKIPVEDWFELLDADNDCATTEVEDNAPALQTQSRETVTLAESDDEIIEIEQNQVTAQDAMSSIGIIRPFLANQRGRWPHMRTLRTLSLVSANRICVNKIFAKPQ